MPDAPRYDVMRPLERSYWMRMLTWGRQELHDTVRDRGKPPEQRTAARALLEILNNTRKSEV